MQLQVSVSIGIAVTSDSDFDIKGFIGNAYIAKYHSKDSSPRKYAVFDPHVKEKKWRLAIANALSQAISKNEFQVDYQAKVNREKKVVGYEALIRWKIESLGFISPDELVPIAEQRGNISLMTFWGCNICVKT